MKLASFIALGLAGLAVAAPQGKGNDRDRDRDRKPDAQRADLQIEFYTDREYRGDPETVTTIDEGECSKL
jgi:hypothetical protein